MVKKKPKTVVLITGGIMFSFTQYVHEALHFTDLHRFSTNKNATCETQNVKI